MTDTIPDWAGKRACELLNAEEPFHPYCWPRDAAATAVMAIAKLVMHLEQPPVDPDEEAVKRIIAAYFNNEVEDVFWGAKIHLARAVSQYKQEKGNG